MENLATYADATVDERLDFKYGHRFGVTYAKHHPPFGHGTVGKAQLLHRVAYVELRWWKGVWDKTYRLQSPRMFARTNCGMFFALSPGKGKTCQLPKEDAVICGRCEGKRPSFAKIKPSCEVPRKLARVRLGCIADSAAPPEDEVCA